MRAKPWEVPDGLWERIEPMLPKRQRRFRYPGRKPLDDRLVLQGILFVLLAELHASDQLEWERAIADSSHLQAKKGAARLAPALLIAVAQGASTTGS